MDGAWTATEAELDLARQAYETWEAYGGKALAGWPGAVTQQQWVMVIRTIDGLFAERLSMRRAAHAAHEAAPPAVHPAGPAAWGELLVERADAGAALVYALYHHSAAGFAATWPGSVNRAYLAACKAYGIDRQHSAGWAAEAAAAADGEG